MKEQGITAVNGALIQKAMDDVFKNKKVCVIGKLETYKDKPQIVIQKTDQISISN